MNEQARYATTTNYGKQEGRPLCESTVEMGSFNIARVSANLATKHRRYGISRSVQNDSLYSEDSESMDTAFETVWSSQSKVTAGGYADRQFQVRSSWHGIAA
jgi:hypothetical protein